MYQIQVSGTIKRLSDGVVFGEDSISPLWQEYDSWVKNGGVPEKTSDADIVKAGVKRKAKLLLEQTDWSQTADCATSLKNSQAFAEYRKIVRGIYLAPTENPPWPTMPEAEWSDE